MSENLVDSPRNSFVRIASKESDTPVIKLLKWKTQQYFKIVFDRLPNLVTLVIAF